MHEVDVLIVGGGAAGIAAARRLVGTRLSFIVAEAGDRLGGRAHTVIAEGMPLDLGCGWLHSADRNSWAKLAEAQKAGIDRTPPAWRQQFADLGFTREDQEAAGAAFDMFDKRLREQAPASDCARDALDPQCPWNEYLEALSGYINGAALGQLSIADYLAYAECDTEVNWRLPGGYGALVAAAGADLPVTLEASVTRIDRSGPVLVADTGRGRIAARAVIVAVPTHALATGGLRFDPPLEDKAEAASLLPLGLANKLFLALKGAEELEPDTQLLGNPRSGETGSYYLRPFGRPVIEAFYGGAGAETLEREGVAATAAFAAEELASLFGSGFRKRLRLLAASEWGLMEMIGGSYSHACPGHADARARLRASVEDRIFFAGEACSPCDFSTAHGAHDSGVEAADAVLAILATEESSRNSRDP